MRTIATIISRICDPFAMLAIVFGAVLWRTSVFLPAGVFMVVLPFVLFVIAVKSKYVSNWDISIREERPKILWPLVIIELTGVLIFQLFSFLPIVAILVGFVVITHFWKISGHAMCAALASGILVKIFGVSWWPVLLIVPLVCWARVYRRDHTLWQVIAGSLYAWILLVIARPR
jgi:hypothetical protein